jgi:hypothetical protein
MAMPNLFPERAQTTLIIEMPPVDCQENRDTESDPGGVGAIYVRILAIQERKAMARRSR